MRAGGGPDVQHRGELPWDVAPVPARWRSCQPQTVELYCEGGVVTSSGHCARGAITDRTGMWRRRNTRRHPDPAGLCRSRMPQPVRTRLVAGISLTPVPATTRVSTRRAGHE